LRRPAISRSAKTKSCESLAPHASASTMPATGLTKNGDFSIAIRRTCRRCRQRKDAKRWERAPERLFVSQTQVDAAEDAVEAKAADEDQTRARAERRKKLAIQLRLALNAIATDDGGQGDHAEDRPAPHVSRQVHVHFAVVPIRGGARHVAALGRVAKQ